MPNKPKIAKWKRITTPLKTGDFDAFEKEASKRGLRVAALLYATLHQITEGFTRFDHLPNPPEGKRYLVTAEKEAQQND